MLVEWQSKRFLTSELYSDKIPSLAPARMHRDRNARCGKLGSEFETYNLAIMRRCTSVTDRRTERQTDTDIVTFHAKNHAIMSHYL